MTKEYLVETKKALEIVERVVNETHHEMPPVEKLKLAKSMMVQTKEFDQYEFFKKEVAALEFEIQAGGEKRYIPVEVKEKIVANREIEMAELDGVLDVKYKKLGALISGIEREVLPLLKEINELHKHERGVMRLDNFLNATYGYTEMGEKVSLFSPNAGTRNKVGYAEKLLKETESLLVAFKGAK